MVFDDGIFYRILKACWVLFGADIFSFVLPLASLDILALLYLSFDLVLVDV